MFRISVFWGSVLSLAVVSLSCSCGSDNSTSQGGLDSGQTEDASMDASPSECPDAGTEGIINDPCIGDTICTYSKSFGNHRDFCIFDCPPGYEDYEYPDYADTVTFQCRNGRWDIIGTTGSNCDETFPEKCTTRILDGGIDGGYIGIDSGGNLDDLDSSTDDDDAGN